jgi:DNA-binding NtrC family response regulator
MQNNKKPLILVVDDEEGTRNGLKTMFERGYSVDTAKDSMEALALIGRKNYAVILLDIMLPGMHGDKLLAAIKAMRPAAKVIMITALKDGELFLDCNKMGAFAHIEKPFKNKELESLV